MKRKLQIGNVVVPGIVALGPMAGVTDLSFRTLCKECGADLIYTEMVSAKGILYNNKNTEALLDIHPDELPVSLQIFGSEPDIMAETAKRIEDRPFAILDVNMGCPVPKVVNNGEGSALMKNPSLVEAIVSKTVKAIRKPVTVKIRKGLWTRRKKRWGSFLPPILKLLNSSASSRAWACPMNICSCFWLIAAKKEKRRSAMPKSWQSPSWMRT